MSKLSDEQKLAVVAKYESGLYTVSALAREYGLHRMSITGLLQRRGIPINNDRSKLMRRYPFNENYFNIITDEHRAYWLGWIYSDGCVHSDTCAMTLRIQASDKLILEKFNADVASARPIHVYKPNNPKHKDTATLALNSPIIHSDLIRLGCVPAKSMVLKFPTEEQVPRHLLKHWIRGVFDGDGHLGFKTTKRGTYELVANIVGTKWICDGIDKFVKSELDINTAIRLAHGDLNDITSLWIIGGTNMAREFMEWMYKDATVWLDRKYNLFQESKLKIDSKKCLVEAFGERKIIERWFEDERCLDLGRMTIKNWIDSGGQLEDLIARKSTEKPRTKYEAFSEWKTASKWSSDIRCGISLESLKKRLATGKPLEQIIQEHQEKEATKQISAFGEVKTIGEWLKDNRCADLYFSLIRARIDNGWTEEAAITTPISQLNEDYGPKPYIAFGETKSLYQWSKDARCLVGYTAIRDRLERGWKLEEAMTTPKISRGRYNKRAA